MTVTKKKLNWQQLNITQGKNFIFYKKLPEKMKT